MLLLFLLFYYVLPYLFVYLTSSWSLLAAWFK